MESCMSRFCLGREARLPFLLVMDNQCDFLVDAINYLLKGLTYGGTSAFYQSLMI
jgi:hypothetical protein